VQSPRRDFGIANTTAFGTFSWKGRDMQPSADKKLFTVRELSRMEEAGLFQDERVELIHGEIFLMPTGSRHQARVDRLTALLGSNVSGRAIVRIQGPLFLDNYNLPEPDAMLIKSRPDFYEHKHPGPEDVLLIMEIADSSLERDREVKLALYAIAGIRECWIEDIQADTLLVFRDPMEDHYHTILKFQRGQTLAPLALPEVQFSVDGILG
jgi:Uma2 family endonuclease